MVGVNMDCGTCETAPTIEIIQPKVVDVSLTLTEKAIEMLTTPSVMIEVMLYWSVSFQVAVQVTCTIYKLSNQPISTVKNSKYQASEYLFRTLHPIFSMELKWIMSTVSWVVDSKSTIQTLQVLVVAANPLLEEQPWASSNSMHMYCSFRVKIDTHSLTACPQTKLIRPVVLCSRQPVRKSLMSLMS